jgi:hypothetical protein
MPQLVRRRSVSYTKDGRRPLARHLQYPISKEGAPMFRFDQLIRRDMIIRDVKQRYPETVPVFDSFRFRSSCDDCDIETVARKNGLQSRDVIDSLNQAAFGSGTET